MDFLRHIFYLVLVIQLSINNYGYAKKYCYTKDIFRPQNKHFGSTTMYPIDYGNKSHYYYLPGKFLAFFNSILCIKYNKMILNLYMSH